VSHKRAVFPRILSFGQDRPSLFAFSLGPHDHLPCNLANSWSSTLNTESTCSFRNVSVKTQKITVVGLQVLTAVNCRPGSRFGLFFVSEDGSNTVNPLFTWFQFKAVEGYIYIYIPLMKLRRFSAQLERVCASVRSNMAEECVTWLEPNRIEKCYFG
jgi:hypothetical protein